MDHCWWKRTGGSHPKGVTLMGMHSMVQEKQVLTKEENRGEGTVTTSRANGKDKDRGRGKARDRGMIMEEGRGKDRDGGRISI